ncbi:serine hydrolase domain-containing protein [Sphingomonas hengshuiensis]|uniref:serine hydrolase domain-containing protein n=1 Tax=Sphingomonas hengshuiensis TaxID=1609977 RepID=UPI00098099B3|nr:serine hydrolase domain-containing protein [Sphingomonas hengshuiensis]
MAAIIAVTCAFHPARSRAADATGGRHQQVDAIFKTDGKTPGCAVAISRAGSLDYARGYGLANLEHDIPITPQSIFLAASISKQFTAFSIGLLAQDGKLSLDDDIRKYVPEMPDYGRPITIAQLIHHTDGLREQGQLLNLAGWRGEDMYTEEDILWALSRQRQLNFAPGSEIVYGNAAYTLLGLIVRRVSGQSLRAFAESRIFKPLGMTDSHFRDDRSEVVPRRASAYSPRADGGWSENVPNVNHYGSTGLLTTVVDLLKWQRNLLDGRVGGAALAAWMRTSGTLNDGTDIGYGGGLTLGRYRGLHMVRHDGADAGYRAEAILFPDQQLAIIALCNGAAIDPTSLTRRVADVYLGDQMQLPALVPSIEVSDAEQSALAGVYWSPTTDEVVQLEWTDGVLRQAGSPTSLDPIGPGVFRPIDLPHEWRFVPSAAGAPTELHIRDAWPTHRVFVRVTSPLPDLAALNALTGQYRSEETDMTYTVRVIDGRLRLSWPRAYDLALAPVGGDRFVGPRGTVTFTRTASGEVNGLTISNRRLRRLRAVRL